jgi:ATP-binding cassette subfamily B protein
MRSNSQSKGIGAEVRLILRRAGEVWKLVPRRHKVALGVVAVVMAITSACNTAMPLLLGGLVDRVKAGADQQLSHAALFQTAAWFLGGLALAYVLREALNVVRRYLVENTCTSINRDMNVQLVAHVMKIDLATLHQERVGALHGRMARGVDGFIRFLRMSFLDFFPAFITGGFALAAAVAKQPLLGLVMLGVVPMAVYLTVRQMISQKGVRLKLIRSCEEIDGAVVEHLGGIEYVRAADTHAIEVKRLAKACERRRAKEIRHHFQMALFGCAKALNEGFFHILVLGLAIYLAITQPAVVSFGDVLTFSILFLSVMAPLSEFHRVLDEGHEASLRVGDLLALLHQPADPSFRPKGSRDFLSGGPRLLPGTPVAAVEGHVVEYATPDGKRKRALDGISLAIRYGETIGVAGRSGSGKSTWLKVLLRLTHPLRGAVHLGGAPVDMAARADIGRLVGYVPQAPFVFSGTIAENIAYGNEGAGRDDVRRAAELAHIHDEIMLMPGGYDAEVTERGSNLSGGQRQRLAIARILLKQPPILILDEATSALDNISERHVQRSLGLTSADRTTILVAHRLTTLRDADRIVVFEEGHIVEVGAYEELLQRGGVFTELVLSAERGSAENLAGAKVPAEAAAR